jgi:hypothetical protein
VARALQSQGAFFGHARDHGRGELAPHDLARQVRPGHHGDALRGRASQLRAGHLGDDLAHPQAAAELDPLHEADQQRPARQQRRPLKQVRPQRLRGHREGDQVRAVQRLGRI